MEYYKKIQSMTKEELTLFILNQIKSECGGNYDDFCRQEGYSNCYDCVVKMLNREAK